MARPKPVLSETEKIWLRAAGVIKNGTHGPQNGRRFEITTNPNVPHA